MTAALHTMNMNVSRFDPELYSIFLDVLHDEDGFK